MKIISSFGKDNLAKVYVADFGDGRIAEFVESLQPPIPRKDKWVLIISTSFGCAVNCMMCDAGGVFKGRCSTEQMFEQLDFLISRRYPDLEVPVDKFKVQFARMGEPAFNKNVLEVLQQIDDRYIAPGLMPCISTIAPANTNDFFERLLEVKNTVFSDRYFQLQFSLHSTDEAERDRLIPIPKWTLEEIAEFGKRFSCNKRRKITLNFALVKGVTLDANVMAAHFSPELFMVKITPVNPTYMVIKNDLESYISPDHPDRHYKIVEQLREYGFETLISIGEIEENLIGSNCGQYVMKHVAEPNKLENSYTYIKTPLAEDTLR